MTSSCVAVDAHVDAEAGRIVGAARVIEKRKGQLFLDILFVLPEYQRQGVATALVSSAMSVMLKVGFHTLESAYFLGNDASQSWHRHFGFVEKSDLSLTRLYYHHTKHELWCREQSGDLTELAQQTLQSQVQHWKQHVEELEHIAEKQGFEAVCPLLRQ